MGGEGSAGGRRRAERWRRERSEEGERSIAADGWGMEGGRVRRVLAGVLGENGAPLPAREEGEKRGAGLREV